MAKENKIILKQQILYDPIKTWLQSRGFDTLITGGRTDFVIPISEFISMPYKVPDLIGVNKEHKVVIVEVEKDKKRFFDALGRCVLWRCMATYAFLAFPKDEISHAPFLKGVGVGLLAVDTQKKVVDEIVCETLFKIQELHPTEYRNEKILVERIKSYLD